jgi:hypothetical protein
MISLFAETVQSRIMPHLFIPRALGSKFKRQLQFEFEAIVNPPPFRYNIFSIFQQKNKIKNKQLFSVDLTISAFNVPFSIPK